jgi:hypothetical protein
MPDAVQEMLSYYSQPGPMTDPGEYARWLKALPCDLPALCQATQSLLIHVFWAKRYEVTLDEARQNEVQIRPVKAKLARLLALDPSPLDVARPPEKRLVGNCRDITTFLCAALRFQHTPARARCGFGIYFMEDHFEDHWVAEVWKADEGRWAMVDAQLDALQREVLGIPFNTLDLPPGQFVPAGQAWLMCRQGQADPDKFGIFEWHGWDFIRGNLARDLLALNKIEVLPWDFWGLLKTPASELPPEGLSWLDRLAELTLSGNDSFPAVRTLYEETPELHVPLEWII